MPWMVLIVALAWIALTGKLDPLNALLGLVLALACLRLAGTKLGLSVRGLGTAPRVIGLAFFLLRQLVFATTQVALLVLRPRLRLRPAILALPLELEHDWQITLLAQMITLTPGTLALEVSSDRRTLFVHFLDLTDPEQAKRAIKQGFERRIRGLAP